MSDKIEKKGKVFNWKFYGKKILNAVSHFLPEGTEVIIDAFHNALNDPTTIEPLIEREFESLLANLKMPYNHIRYCMGFNEHKKMQYIIEVWNPELKEWIFIPFPASRFIANMFNDDTRTRTIKAVQVVINLAHEITTLEQRNDLRRLIELTINGKALDGPIQLNPHE